LVETLSCWTFCCGGSSRRATAAGNCGQGHDTDCTSIGRRIWRVQSRPSKLVKPAARAESRSSLVQTRMCIIHAPSRYLVAGHRASTDNGLATMHRRLSRASAASASDPCHHVTSNTPIACAGLPRTQPAPP
jgi:hypothetical protein